jgi:hypothetical protein
MDSDQLSKKHIVGSLGLLFSNPYQDKGIKHSTLSPRALQTRSNGVIDEMVRPAAVVAYREDLNSVDDTYLLFVNWESEDVFIQRGTVLEHRAIAVTTFVGISYRGEDERLVP